MDNCYKVECVHFELDTASNSFSDNPLMFVTGTVSRGRVYQAYGPLNGRKVFHLNFIDIGFASDFTSFPLIKSI